MDVGLNNDWIRNIMTCIESPKMSILLNGDQLDWFKPSRGVRQGDSISLYIFVLCVERLSRVIGRAVENGEWRFIRLFRQGPTLSYLFFADDLVVFAKASVEKLRVVMRCLDLFCRSSRQRVNHQKSQILVSANVENSLALSLSQI